MTGQQRWSNSLATLLVVGRRGSSGRSDPAAGPVLVQRLHRSSRCPSRASPSSGTEKPSPIPAPSRRWCNSLIIAGVGRPHLRRAGHVHRLGHHAVPISRALSRLVRAGGRSARRAVVGHRVSPVCCCSPSLDIDLSLQTIGVMHVMTTFPLGHRVGCGTAGAIRTLARRGGPRPGRVAVADDDAVVLPQLAPALAASFIFAFAWSFNNFEISFFTGGYDQTFPVWVYSRAAQLQQPADRQRDVDPHLRRSGRSSSTCSGGGSVGCRGDAVRADELTTMVTSGVRG